MYLLASYKAAQEGHRQSLQLNIRPYEAIPNNLAQALINSPDFTLMGNIGSIYELSSATDGGRADFVQIRYSSDGRIPYQGGRAYKSSNRDAFAQSIHPRCEDWVPVVPKSAFSLLIAS